MSERVTVAIDNHVATVSLNRADKQNALDFAMFEALADAGAGLARRSDVRAVVLRGEGGNFCSGMDVSVFQGGSIDPALMAPVDGSPANFFQRPAYVWRELPMPVICAVKGNTFGGGLQIALGADIRIAAADARLSIMEVQWGLIPDLAITTTLRHVLPVDRVKLLTYTGRVLSGSDAKEWGLVTELADDPDKAAADLAATIASLSPDAVRGAKRLINDGWSMDEADALALEAKTQGRLLRSPNTAEAARARAEKRPPVFKDDAS